MSSLAGETQSLSMGAALSVVIVCPDPERRRAAMSAFTGTQSRVALEFKSYPSLDDLSEISEGEHDVVVVDLDPDPEAALDVIEALAGNTRLTLIGYSAQAQPEVLVRCMRAGAREFLTDPIVPNAVAEALVRASIRRDELHRTRKALGKLLVFVSTKGGAGATTVAANFALSLQKQSGGKVALLDLDLHLGDAALLLGVVSKFSAADALDNINRLDADFLAVTMTKHASGLAVLTAPDAVSEHAPARTSVDKLLRVAREEFEYVVVDAGALPPDVAELLLQASTTVYLVTQVAVPELRNANRLISRYFSAAAENGKLEVVVNRFSARTAEIDEPAITKALARPVKWRLPNDFAAARRSQNTGVPIVMEESALAHGIREMAREAAGIAPPSGKKRRFGLF